MNRYSPNDEIKDIIYIIYRNGNHFNLLRKNNINTYDDLGLKEINKRYKIIEKNLNKNFINKIVSNRFKNVFNKKLIKYNRKGCPDLYQEIYNYLKVIEIPKD